MKAALALRAHAPERFDELRGLFRRASGVAVHAAGESVQWGGMDSEDRQWMEEL